ncbi:neutral/alkaline non-lysosomal ceramidase N-terminal domain-containing protein [Kocuria sp. p3-SID1433]|nr:neutral/alkaline non-lysosomal ceramidase N-terminal domain-containing protein [Kocuria sp. p3-SID1428]MCT2180807.1 neutral/alkaline non-lysosomal ceramidase N-terminal domain-containing protein [Kocuria sp. p3-SID1433]
MALVVADLMCPAEGLRQAVIGRLAQQAPGRWSQATVSRGATHRHATSGDAGYDELQNVTILGFQPQVLEAQVEGIVAAILAVDADRAERSLRVSRSELADDGANRSTEAFRLNPEDLRAALPNGLDTSSTTLRMERGGAVDAVVNRLAAHSTSLTNTNRLVFGHNKGYAQYALERLGHGVDLTAQQRPAFVAAFANSNSGDISPNLNLRPGSGHARLPGPPGVLRHGPHRAHRMGDPGHSLRRRIAGGRAGSEHPQGATLEQPLLGHAGLVALSERSLRSGRPGHPSPPCSRSGPWAGSSSRCPSS